MTKAEKRELFKTALVNLNRHFILIDDLLKNDDYLDSESINLLRQVQKNSKKTFTKAIERNSDND